jgi:drug/metabolite transporter (DMT)-like permease
MKQQPFVHPMLAMTTGIFAASTASIFIRYAQAYTPSLVIAAYRLGLATLILAPFALWRYRRAIFSMTRREVTLTLLSGFFLALHFATWISSLEYTTVASSVVLVTTTPLWVALISPFTIKEPINRLVRLGMFVALAGGVVIAANDACIWNGAGLQCPDLATMIGGRAFLGDALAVAGAVMAACYLLIGRSLRNRMSLVNYVFVVYGMAAVVLVAIVLGAGLPPFDYPPQAYLWFLLLALIPQLLGHSSFNWALRYISAGYVSTALLGEPIASTILAYFLLGEMPTGLKIFGAILILAGIYVASRSERA